MSEQNTHQAALPQGTIRYTESGEGAPIVFVHGLLVNGTLWGDVAPRLAQRHRCIVPDWPLGSHPTAMNRAVDLSPPGVARIVADFLDALDLRDVTLVGNDTGGAICQLVAVNHPERLGGLVLTNCDAYENFLPPAFRPLQVMARIPGATTALMQGLRLEPMRRGPLGFGMLTKRPIDPAVLEGWVRPVLSDRGVRRDLVTALKGISSRYTLEAAERLGGFTRPTLIAWAPEDPFFKRGFAERLAAAIPRSKLEWIEDARTFTPLDQPERLATLIDEFTAAKNPSAATTI